MDLTTPSSYPCAGVSTGSPCPDAGMPCACINLADKATIAEWKQLLHAATGYAVRPDTSVWTVEEEASFRQWLLDQEAHQTGNPDLLAYQTGSGWAYPTGYCIDLMLRDVCRGGDWSAAPSAACAAAYPLLLAAVTAAKNQGVAPPIIGAVPLPVTPVTPVTPKPPVTPGTPVTEASSGASSVLWFLGSAVVVVAGALLLLRRR